MKRRLESLVVVISALVLVGQECPPTAGEVVVYEEDALDGYTLVSDYLMEEATLIDMTGTVVRQWSTITFPAKMLPGGYIIAGGDEYNPNTPWISPDTKEIVQYGWGGEVVSQFSNWDDQGTGMMMARHHHDFQREGSPVGYYAPDQEPLARGKTLVMAHKDAYVDTITNNWIQDDVYYEIDAAGQLTGFEWHASEHIEEFGFDDDARAAIAADPNCDEESGLCDWLHGNTGSYLGPNHWYDSGDERFNPKNIVYDSRNANFIVIISWDTGHVVWRVGPDFGVGTPEHDLGQLQGPHHAHMIPQGLPGEGNILVFDNGSESGYGGPDGYPKYQPREYSRVFEFDPVTLEKVWEYGVAPGDEHFYSTYISSAQRLPNGNTLITVGQEARVMEITSDKRLVWDYRHNGSNMVYRTYRIPPEWLPEGENLAQYTEWEDIDF